MTPAARPPRPRWWQRAVQAVTAGTALALAAALAVGVAGRDDEGSPGAEAEVVAGHHGGTTLAPAVEGGEPGPDDAQEPAGTRDPHDHGDLEVTVMLAVDGETQVQGPVEPGSYFSLVNHTDADQLLTTADGGVTADVPLRRLVTLQAPETSGTYRLVSTTDRTVSAELVVAGPAA